jgi:membrane protein
MGKYFGWLIKLFQKRSILKNIKITLTDTWEQMQDGEIRLVASSLAFSTLLALIPFIAVTLSVFREIGGLEFLYPRVEAFVLSYLEQATSQQAIVLIKKILQKIHAGAVGTTGALALFLASYKLLHDMEFGINRVWNVKIQRAFHRRVALNILLLMLIPLSLAIYVSFRSLSLVKPVVRSNYGQFLDFIILFVGIYFLYKQVPNLKVRNRPALLSACLASISILILKVSYTWLTGIAFSYSKVYGSLAALPLLCLWILGLWYILLAGVAFCASTQRRHWLEENYGFDFGT